MAYRRQLWGRASALVLAVLLRAAVAVACIPFINNFGREDYGSGNYTWRIASYGRWTFFTNERGLLAYDGVRWKKYELNNRSEARGVAVFPQSRRIYVGGENEYGFFEIGKSGALEYHCLSDSVEEKYRRVGNVWEIYELSGSLYLRCDDYILVMAGKRQSLIETKDKIFASVLVDGVIYVATDHGVKMVAGERLLPIMNGEAVDGKRINAMFRYSQGMIVTTATDGLFYYDGHRVQPFPTPADALLRQGVICCAAIRGDTVALGTIHNGLVLLNMKTGEVSNYGEREGLQNNTVLSVGFDHEGNVWAGMDYGIDRLLTDAPFTYLYKGPQSYGIGYAAQPFGQRLYLGTDRGLFSTDYGSVVAGRPASIDRVSCPSGPAWFLYRNGDELFCLHDKGIFTVSGTQATKVTDIIGAWACQAVEGHPELMFVGLYRGLCLIEKRDGRWTSVGAIEGITEPGRYFRQTGPRQLTVYNRNLGTAIVYDLDATLRRVTAQRQIQEEWRDEGTSETERLFADWNVSGRIVRLDDQRELVPCSRGFILFNQQKTKRTIAVFIRQLEATTPADTLCYADNFCGVKSVPQLSFDHNSVRITYGVQTLQIATAVSYQYRLDRGEWSAPTTQTVKEYSNLHEGTHTFEVKAVMLSGTTTSDSLTFRILPPWYRTWPAYLFYLLLLGGAIIFLFRLEKRYVVGKQQLAVAEKNEEVKQMKVEIDQLEKDKMDLELKHKTQEIANLVLSVARKNETLADLKEAIRTVAFKLDRQNAVECKRELLLINNKIDSNMEGDEVLKRFEEQFDLVNDSFMQRLSERHPDLSNNERLMCAYLKMNLSTKEIAPLLNISVRGVETMRYRIRKKFGLERDSSLTEYMNSIIQ